MLRSRSRLALAVMATSLSTAAMRSISITQPVTAAPADVPAAVKMPKNRSAAKRARKEQIKRNGGRK